MHDFRLSTYIKDCRVKCQYFILFSRTRIASKSIASCSYPSVFWLYYLNTVYLYLQLRIEFAMYYCIIEHICCCFQAARTSPLYHPIVSWLRWLMWLDPDLGIWTIEAFSTERFLAIKKRPTLAFLPKIISSIFLD